ncbi:hypothetical protein LNTAR_13497 [Lentisphaera araneosa HTCC2155]|jgi:RHS repeat-associated protein|uniref:Uncharacterized protein n=1 Tax=Lentisphaera araneosa HTCC2155 TaxID=313628 RepID=A6DGV1_9BACT|nr:hypothetical protein [Lentisphaera araneosa]EDM28834.1 hypothetical protein LNTAR_13497 [Lentisphaera araneosa HTCC2155]
MAFFFNQNAYALRLSLDKNYTYDSQNISLLPVKLHRPNSNTLALDYAYDTRTSTLDYRTTLKLNRNCNILYSPTPYCIIFLIFSYNYDASPKQYDSISPHNAYDANSDDFRARYYSTELGQFISRDPLEYVDGMNMYSGYFARQFGVDPSGLKLKREFSVKVSAGAFDQYDFERHKTGKISFEVENCCSEEEAAKVLERLISEAYKETYKSYVMVSALVHQLVNKEELNPTTARTELNVNRRSVRHRKCLS